MVVGLKEDQYMHRWRHTVLLDDCSLFGMRIVGSKAILGMYITRLGETHGRGSFDCADWVMIVWL